MRKKEFISTYSNKLNDILTRAIKENSISEVTLTNGFLYIVNKEIYGEILILLNEANNIKLSHERKDKKKVTENSYYIVKMMNSVSAYKYTLDTKEKYVIITSEELIKERLQLKFKIWISTQNKILENTIKEKNLYGDSKTDLENEFKNNISIASNRLDFILDNYTMFKSSLTSYKEKRTYEVLYFTTDDKKTHQEHLRTSVPNILYFNENEELDKNQRSDKVVDKIVINGKQIFDNFYVEKKDDEYWNKLEDIKG